AIQLNYLLDQRAVTIQGDGVFAVNPDRIKEGVAGLTREIMTIQAEGDYEKAKSLGERLGIVRPQVQQALDKLQSIPVDIEPRFISADQLGTRMRSRDRFGLLSPSDVNGNLSRSRKPVFVTRTLTPA